MIGYRKLDGSTVLPDGTIVYKDGTRSAPRASPYPPAAEIGGLHPVTLPDPPATPGIFTVEATPPATSGYAPTEAEQRRLLEIQLRARDEQYATQKRWTIGLGIVAVIGLVTAGALATRSR